jgi:hypothetical protein
MGHFPHDFTDPAGRYGRVLHRAAVHNLFRLPRGLILSTAPRLQVGFCNASSSGKWSCDE